MDAVDIFIFFGLLTVGFLVGAMVFYPLGQRSILRMKTRAARFACGSRDYDVLEAEYVEKRR